MEVMTPELKAALERLKNHKMTAREKFEQRVSFVFGMQDFDRPGMTKDEIRRHLADHGGYPDEWQEAPAMKGGK